MEGVSSVEQKDVTKNTSLTWSDTLTYFRPASLLKMSPFHMFFKYLASKNQLHGFYIGGTLVENGLMILLKQWCFNALSPIKKWVNV